MAVPAVAVTVVDGRSGARLCSADVSVREGTLEVQLETHIRSTVADCVYTGAYERAGTYIVRAALGERTASIADVMVERDVCHVRTRSLTIELP